MHIAMLVFSFLFFSVVIITVAVAFAVAVVVVVDVVVIVVFIVVMMVDAVFVVVRCLGRRVPHCRGCRTSNIIIVINMIDCT